MAGWNRILESHNFHIGPPQDWVLGPFSRPLSAPLFFNGARDFYEFLGGIGMLLPERITLSGPVTFQTADQVNYLLDNNTGVQYMALQTYGTDDEMASTLPRLWT
jgi:hypothetical protein